MLMVWVYLIQRTGLNSIKTERGTEGGRDGEKIDGRENEGLELRNARGSVSGRWRRERGVEA